MYTKDLIDEGFSCAPSLVTIIYWFDRVHTYYGVGILFTNRFRDMIRANGKRIS